MALALSRGYAALSRLARGELPLLNRRTVTADTTVNALDELLRVDATAGAVTITLRPSQQPPRRPLRVKKIDDSANAVTIAAADGETIEGASSVTLAAQWDHITLLPGDAGWEEY
ncbi:MAG TPA: hypothetical protein VFM74_05025 [Candidatus Limnocylindria bacterium]|nr:hypothetical protein [Candidatus Limnocylindria bacterium]